MRGRYDFWHPQLKQLTFHCGEPWANEKRKSLQFYALWTRDFNVPRKPQELARANLALDIRQQPQRKPGQSFEDYSAVVQQWRERQKATSVLQSGADLALQNPQEWVV